MKGLSSSLSWSLIAGVVAIAVYVGFFRPSAGPDAGGHAGRKPAPVTVAKVASREFVDVIESVGTARANESNDLTAKATETIGALYFTDGQKVQQGFVVAELTSVEQSADLAAARTELKEQTDNYERTRELHARGLVAAALLDAATAARDSAEARVRSLESRVSDRLIKAPFAGVLGLRQVSVGTLVRPGELIATLDDISIIKVDFTVPETYLAALRVGMEVRASVEAWPNRTFEGRVAGIDTRVDPVSRSLALRAEIANPEEFLRPGMLVTVSLLKNRRHALAVPEQSLVPVEDKQYVYVVGTDSKAERRAVTIGARIPGSVEVLDGLRAGESVVVDGTIRLRPGMSVQVVASGGGAADLERREPPVADKNAVGAPP